MSESDSHPGVKEVVVTGYATSARYSLDNNRGNSISKASLHNNENKKH